MRRIPHLAAIATLVASIGITTVTEVVTASSALAGPPASPLVSADALPTWQTNGTVWAMETVGDVVYVGGNFTKVRPPSTPVGSTKEVARKNMAAFDAKTGALLPFTHAFTSPVFSFNPTTTKPDVSCNVDWNANTYTCDTVYEIRKSPDGKKIFVSGDFTWVDGKDRRKLAAFSTENQRTVNNALDTGFKVYGTDSRVRSLAVTANAVYAAGTFTKTGNPSVARSKAAAFNPTTGALLPWAPNVEGKNSNGGVLAMTMSPDNSRVILGGEFDKVNGVNIHGLAAVDAVTGANTRWDSRPIPLTSFVTDLVTDHDTVYAGAEGIGSFDGRLAADPNTGILRWVDTCLGATWSLALIGDVLYSGSHAHNCSNTDGGFPEQNKSTNPNPRWYRLLAQSARSPQTTIQHWFPNTNAGDYTLPADRTPSRLGPRTMTTDGEYLWVGGQFTAVNGRAQQSITRFGKVDTGAPPVPATPRATSPFPGRVHVTYTTVVDDDDETLRYTIYRNGQVVGTVDRASKPWNPNVSLTFADNAAPSGQTVTYQVTAQDPDGHVSAKSGAVSVQVR